MKRLLGWFWISVNLVLVAAYGVWASGAVFGVYPVPLCDNSLFGFAEGSLSVINLPAYLLAQATSAVLPATPQMQVVIKQFAWTALVAPQWLAIFWAVAAIRKRLDT